MSEFVKVKIFGGYHTGQEYEVSSDLKVLCLEGDNVMDIHKYKHLPILIQRSINNIDFSSYEQLELPVEIYVPVDTSVEHGNEIRDLVLMSATAKWVQKERKFDIHFD